MSHPTVFTLRIDPALYAMLREQCYAERCSRNEWIIAAIEQRLASGGEPMGQSPLIPALRIVQQMEQLQRAVEAMFNRDPTGSALSDGDTLRGCRICKCSREPAGEIL